MNPRHRNTAFSLLELLIAIAIIAVLVAILFPLTSSLRQRGQTTTCMAHMRQLSIIVLQYSQDHGGRLLPAAMGANAWMNDLVWYYNLNNEGYLPATRNDPNGATMTPWSGNRNSIMACPSRPNPPGAHWAVGSHALHYAVNQNPGFLNRVDTSTGKWPRLALIASPGRTFMLAESNGPLGYTDGAGFVYPHSNSGDYTNGKGMNLVFYDGHAEYFRGRLPVLPGPNYSQVPYGNISPEQSFPFF